MDAVSAVLQRFALASAGQREEILHGLMNNLTDREAVSMARYWSWQNKKLDILSELPLELQLGVIDHLDVKTLFSCTLVCCSWRNLFLNTALVVNDLLLKRFPLLGKGSGDENSRLLFQAIRNRYFRATGRFRTRLTISMGQSANAGAGGTFSPGRLECLKSGHTFIDRLECSATPVQVFWLQPSRGGPAAHVRCYAKGRFASQPPGPARHIVVHDFRTGQHKLFKHPRATLVSGFNTRLLALGDKLVVASCARTIFAWDLATGLCHEITLPNSAKSCITQNFTVLVTVQDDQMFVWESLNRLVEVDTAVPMDHANSLPGAQPSSEPPRLMVGAGAEDGSPPLFFGADGHTFYFVEVQKRLAYGTQRLLIIYEFQLCNNKYKASRYFSHGLGNEERKTLWTEIRKVDAYGTFQVLQMPLNAPFGYVHHVQYVLFNTSTTSFSVETYESPYAVARSMVESSALWERQLVHPWDRRPFKENPFPMLVALEPSMITDTFSPIGPARSYIHVSKEGNPQVPRALKDWPESFRRDIVRDRYVGENSTEVPIYGSIRGFQYALSFQTIRPCTYTGAHQPNCPSYRQEGTAAANHLTECPVEEWRRQFNHPGWAWELAAVKVYADEDFLVVVSNWGTYTVFCMDPDRKIAEGIERWNSQDQSKTSEMERCQEHDNVA